jgi:hypothetical protein
MNEKELERIAGILGKRAAARLDVERTAASVLARLRSQPAARVRPWWGSPALLRLAAALTITLGGVFTYRLMSRAPGTEGREAPLSALQVLSSDDLEEVLDSVSIEAPAYETMAVGLHDLNDQELSELLHRLEG